MKKITFKKPEFKKPEFKKLNLKLNINYEFNKREKILLYVLGLALLVVATIFLVIMPGMEKYKDISAKRDEAVFKQQEMELAIAGIEVNRKAKDAANADLNTKKEGYSAKLNNEELDNLITNFVVDRGFKPQSLSITENSIAAVPTFKGEGTQADTSTPTVEETNQLKEMQDLADQQGTTTNNDGSTTTTAAKTITGIYIGKVTMSITGNISQFENLLDAVSNRSDMQIVTFDVAPETSTSSSRSITEPVIANIRTGSNTASVTFNVYMLDKGTVQTEAAPQTEAPPQ